MQLTVKQAIDADAGLAILSQVNLPMPLAVKIARLRFGLGLIIDPVTTANKANIEAAADRDDAGGPKVTSDAAGNLRYDLTAAEQFRVQRDFETAGLEVVTLDAAPLQESDFPAAVRGESFAIAPAVLTLLGPLFG